MANESITPTVAEVAARLLARTRTDATGTPTGTFDDTTNPTAEAVEDFISDYVTEIALIVAGVDEPEVLAFAKGVVAVGAASDVELSIDPDRVDDTTSAYARLLAQYERRLVLLREQAAAALARQAAEDKPGRGSGSVRLRSSVMEDVACERGYPL